MGKICGGLALEYLDCFSFIHVLSHSVVSMVIMAVALFIKPHGRLSSNPSHVKPKILLKWYRIHSFAARHAARLA